MPEPLQAAFARLFEESIKSQQKLFSLHIHGIEVTQATQHFDSESHLTDFRDRGPDNSIALIAGKTALVRVYVRHHATDLPGVSGTLTVSRPGPDGRWSVLGRPMALAPGVVTARAAPTYAAERGSLWRTLNFRLPAWMVRGGMRITASITAPDGRADTRAIDVAAALQQTLRIRGIPVRYEGKDGAGNKISLARPSLADFASTASDALAMFPVSDQPDITLTGEFNWFAPLDGAPDPANPGGCAPSWNSLLYWLNLMKTADGNRSDRIYYGLVPSATPIGFNSGCGSSGGVSAGRVGDTPAFAHECGHVLGFAHAPCGLTAGDPGDPAYPAYEPYDTPAARMASIGEYGVDTRGPFVLSPATARDFMSYCSPPWIGPHHYRQLLQHALLAPRRVYDRGPRLPDWAEDLHMPELDLPRPGPLEIGPDLSWQRPPSPRPLLTLTGHMRNGQLTRVDMLRLPTRPATLGPALPGAVVELRNADGVLLERARLHQLPLRGGCGGGCGCGGRGCDTHEEPGFENGLVQAVLPDRDDIDSAQVVRDGQTLWRRGAADCTLRISEFSASVDAAHLVLKWRLGRTGESGDEQPFTMVLGSADGGQDWQVLWFSAPPPDGPARHATLALDALPPGCLRVRVLACDGFHTAHSDAVDIEVPPRAPTAVVLWPRQGGAVRCGELLTLRGMALAADGTPLPEDALRWELDGQRIGGGAEVQGELGAWEGEHRATLLVRDQHGQAQAEVIFTATCSGEAPVQLRLG